MTLTCGLCGKKTRNVFKHIDGVSIYECEYCQLGFIDQSNFKKRKLKHLYGFEEYKKVEKVISKRLDELTDIITHFKKKGKVLEIGPGFGMLSSFLLQKGKYTLDVVEPLLIPKYLSKKVYKMHRSDLETFLRHRKKKYDLIIMFDVIEHLKNPFQSLKKLSALLNPKGLLVIQTPNYKSFMQEIVEKWSWWMIEDHKWFFTPFSLREAAKKNSLEVIHEHTYEDWRDFRKNLDGNFVKYKYKIARKIAKLLFFIPFIPFYFLTRHLFWRADRGGLIFAIFKNSKLNNAKQYSS